MYDLSNIRLKQTFIITLILLVLFYFSSFTFSATTFAIRPSQSPQNEESFIRCVGGDVAKMSEDISPSTRACIIHNACYLPNSGWTLFGIDKTYVSDQIIRRKLLIGNSLLVSIKGSEPVPPKIIKFHFSSQSFSKYSSEVHSGLYLFLIPTVHNDNVGHVLFDSIAPIWSSFLQLLPQHYLVKKKEVIALVEKPLKKIQKRLSNFIFDDIVLLKEGMCFESLIIGTRSKSGLTGSIDSLSLYSLRSRFLSRSSTVKPALSLLILKKSTSAWKHHNFITNLPEIDAILHKRFPSLPSMIVDPSGLSFYDQVRNYNKFQAKLLIS